MKTQTKLGMKFLLMIGLFSTGFSLFQVYQAWENSRTSLDTLLRQQVQLAMAFDHAIDQAAHAGGPGASSDSSVAEKTTNPLHFRTAQDIFDNVQENYPYAILRASGPELTGILQDAGSEGARIYRLFTNNPSLDSAVASIAFHGRNYLAQFQINRMDSTPADPLAGLRMIAIPTQGYQETLNDQVLRRFSLRMFALLGLLGAIFVTFEVLVVRRLRRIAAYFRKAALQEEGFHFEPLRIEAHDEIGHLAWSFNRLGQKLAELYDTLDAKVRHRTDKLQQLNVRLRQKMTDCRQAEEQAAVLAQEAMTANRVKSEFLANMSHELRTPMNAIIGFSEVLSDEALTDEQRSCVQIINSSGKSLLALINDILDYSKIEAGKLTVDICDCRLDRLLAEIESMLRPMASQKGIAFEVLQCDTVPRMIQTDPLRLRQCLINLINNAIKFTESGHVYVNVAFEQRDRRPWLRVDVEDTGIGIPKDKQALIFESFTQADSATTRKYGGTGLGLAITKRLAKLLGGDVSVVSESGGGAVFTLTIPAGAERSAEAGWNKYEQTDAILDAEKGTDMYTGKVLVAEDNPSNQKLMQILLQKMGLEVVLASDGLEAVEKGAAETYDLILMDMQMPALNGYDATRRLRSQGVKTPIIAVTAHAMTGDEEKCLAAGCDGYLSKPIERSKLTEIIDRYATARAGSA
ncbi:MAG: ATP-binding protein [Planctomycetales bacterium]|nr:ATP-binding protein [Planctomycetales bacterium]